MTIKSFILLPTHLFIFILLYLPADTLSQTTPECYPPCEEGLICNDSGECTNITFQQPQNSLQQKTELLPTKPRKGIRKPLLAVLFGSLSSGCLVTGIICNSKRSDPYHKWNELREDWKKATDPDKKDDLKKQMDEAQDNVYRVKEYRRRSLILWGVFGIGFGVNLIIPSRGK